MTRTELPVLEPERIDRMRAGVMDAVAQHEAAARRRRRRVRGVLAGAAAAAVVVVGGVGIGLGGLGGTTGQSDSMGAEESSDVGAPTLRSDGGAEGGAEGGVDSESQEPPFTTVVTTGSMSVEVDDVREAVTAIRAFVASRDGRIDTESIESGPNGTASLTVRVPAGDIDALRGEIDDLGTPAAVFLERSDEAAAIADVDARIASLETSIRRLRSIIAESSSTRDLLDAEAQLTQRQSDLEALQAQRRVLRDQTSLATIEVLVMTKDTARAVEPGEGFTGGLTRGWNALVDTVNALVTAVGVAVPWLLPAGLVAVLALAFRRWRVRRDER